MSESIDIRGLCEWSEGKSVRTKAGPRILRTAAPNEEFRTLWKSKKEELRAAGLGWSKTLGGEWEVCWWQADPDASEQFVAAKEEALPPAALEEDPVLPTISELRPYLDKVLASPESAVVIGIERFGGDWRVAQAWLNLEERQVLRKALQKVNAERAKRGEAPTTSELGEDDK